MKQQEIDTWAKSREKGQAKFIVINGVLGWGGAMFILMTFVLGDAHNSEFLWRKVLVGAVVWPLAGLGFGALLWSINERRYAKALKAGQAPKRDEPS